MHEIFLLHGVSEYPDTYFFAATARTRPILAVGAGKFDKSAPVPPSLYHPVGLTSGGDPCPQYETGHLAVFVQGNGEKSVQPFLSQQKCWNGSWWYETEDGLSAAGHQQKPTARPAET